jgi:hypothetical protein
MLVVVVVVVVVIVVVAIVVVAMFQSAEVTIKGGGGVTTITVTTVSSGGRRPSALCIEAVHVHTTEDAEGTTVTSVAMQPAARRAGTGPALHPRGARSRSRTPVLLPATPAGPAPASAATVVRV